MADINNLRITAMLLQAKILDVMAALAPLRALACGWKVDGVNADLPTEAAVSAVLSGYVSLSIPAMNTRAAVRDLEQSDAGNGFALPAVPVCGTLPSGLLIPSGSGLTIRAASGLAVPA